MNYPNVNQLLVADITALVARRREDQLMPPAKFLSKIAVRWMLGVALLWAAGSAHAATCNSTAMVNNWSALATWSCGHVPANGDDVVISSGSTTTLNVNSNTLASLTVNGTLIVGATLNVNNSAAAFLTINSGGVVTIGNSGTARAVTVTGDITVIGTGTFSVGATSATHTLTVGGDITNAGTINFRPSATRVCNVTFNNNGNQTVSGAGAYTFNLITVNMGTTNANILDMQSNMTVPSPFLTIKNGTYRHSNTSNITPWIADPAIPASGGFWLNAAATVTTSVNVSVNGGLLRIDAGTMNIGTVTDSIVLMLDNAATTLFQMDGGALNVTGGIMSGPCGACASGNEVTNAAGTFTLNGGIITLQTIDAGPVETLGLGSATTLNWSGGTIICRNGDNTTYDVDIRSATQNVTGGTLQIGDASESAVNDFLITNQTGGVLNVWNLVLASGNGHTMQLGSTINVLNDLTIQANKTLLVNNAAYAINIGAGDTSGVWTNNGAFTSGNDTVTFTGASAIQDIGGTAATTFYNLTINKTANNLAINTTPTVSNLLTFDRGNIVTGANSIIIGPAATIATPSATSYVVGAIEKMYNKNTNLGYYAGDNFPVGDANNYAPVSITAGTTTTAGSLTVTTTSSDHPEITTPIASTGIDANNDVNRYWTMSTSGLTIGTAISATFNFVAGDIDATANTANFICERYDGSNWNPTTLVVANSLNTQASNITLPVTGSNDFAVGDPLSGDTPVPGSFNAFESSTAANALLGRIYTKLAGVAFSLDFISINAAKTAYGGTVANVTVQLLNSSNNSAALDANGCRSSWVTVQTITTKLRIPVSGRITLSGITIPQAYSDARLEISAARGLIGCSTDRFSIRPQSFTVTSTNATNTGTTGAPTFKTGANFNLTAASVVGYNGTPSIDNTKVVGTPNAGAIGGSFGAASPATGTATGASFFYSEVGNFGLAANAVYDASFTSVDQPNDCTVGSFSNSLTGGKYGCSIGSVAVAQTTGSSGFGRFIPDNFNVSYNAPQFSATCGTFTYVGQPFIYAVAPVLTVTARDGTNNGLTNTTTQNYAGAYMNITNASLSQSPYNTQAGRYTRFDALGGGTTPALDTTGLPATTGDPSIGTFTNGVGTLTFGSGTGMLFIRTPTTPSAPFNADIALALNVNDTDGVAFAGNPAAFGAATSGNGMAFSSGNAIYFGRVHLQNAYGSELVKLPMPLHAEYYVSAANGFVINSADSCTSIAVSQLTLSEHIGSTSTTATIANIPFSAGDAGLSFSPPGAGGSGYVDVIVDLSATAWLHDDLSSCSIPSDSCGRATFGIYKGSPQEIYIREQY
ncbi:MAG: DUF6701 domain-containing protein [Sulfuricaulis sp.]